jgi:hypothetical protein
MRTSYTKNLYLCLSACSGFLTGGIQTYAHEQGHALAARALYQNGNPRIEISNWLWGGGGITYRPINPTWLGSRFSLQTRDGLVAAAGPAADLLNVTTSIYASWKLRKYTPLSIALASNAFKTSVEALLYCCLTPDSPNHDYYVMAKELSIPHSALSSLTALATLTSFIWLVHLSNTSRIQQIKQTDFCKSPKIHSE